MLLFILCIAMLFNQAVAFNPDVMGIDYTMYQYAWLIIMIDCYLAIPLFWLWAKGHLTLYGDLIPKDSPNYGKGFQIKLAPEDYPGYRPPSRALPGVPGGGSEPNSPRSSLGSGPIHAPDYDDSDFDSEDVDGDDELGFKLLFSAATQTVM
ncbi:hypothetical protein GTA08_BOTSDO10831 [Botryosphaeria dothidea]|uniref:Uncharacterized protein n=1 Tax=Botryosphaeria dothidea TaxID=55169 RepID=A0A8H4IIT6_9PEZI|nr:hypothetical protein GTA08_BOTSDO10831 [Botryosphaeria dothidea]